MLQGCWTPLYVLTLSCTIDTLLYPTLSCYCIMSPSTQFVIPYLLLHVTRSFTLLTWGNAFLSHTTSMG